MCLTYGSSHKQALCDYNFFEFIHFGCYFTPLLYYSDKIVKPQFFTHTVTPSTQPSPFHVTIRCDASYILHIHTFTHPHSISVNRWSYRMCWTGPPYAKVSKLNNDASYHRNLVENRGS